MKTVANIPITTTLTEPFFADILIPRVSKHKHLIGVISWLKLHARLARITRI